MEEFELELMSDLEGLESVSELEELNSSDGRMTNHFPRGPL
jgi:hypothetical protein